jgi:stalled ribosome alternative rescue factor ArfA
MPTRGRNIKEPVPSQLFEINGEKERKGKGSVHSTLTTRLSNIAWEISRMGA